MHFLQGVGGSYGLTQSNKEIPDLIVLVELTITLEEIELHFPIFSKALIDCYDTLNKCFSHRIVENVCCI